MRRQLTTIASWILLVIGLALVIVPLVLGVPAKANAGADMMADFKPIMQPTSVQTTKDYLAQFHIMRDDFVPAITPAAVQRFQGYLKAMQAMYGDFQKLLPGLAGQMGMTPEQLQAFLGQSAPGVAAGMQSFPAMGQDFQAVVGMMQKDVDIVQNMPKYLQHYDDLVARMDGNVGNFEKANGLPMRLMPWMFIVPGAIIALLAAVQLIAACPRVASAVSSARPRPGTA